MNTHMWIWLLDGLIASYICQPRPADLWKQTNSQPRLAEKCID